MTRKSRHIPLTLGFFFGLVGVLSAALPASSQVLDTLAVDTAQVVDTLPEEVEGQEEGISPRGAFIRSALIPGWGHAEVGSYVRGAFYFTFESAVAYMILKTQSRVSRARDRNALVEAAATARLLAAGTDSLNIEDALGEEEDVEDSRGLVEARVEQREDWLALGMFLLFLGGADAYVSAHLAEFPAAVQIEGDPTHGMEIAISIPVNFPPG